MGQYSLSRRFKGAMGLPFALSSSFAWKDVIFLSSGRFLMAQVPQMVGFGDLARFDELFKPHTGVTPSPYRSLLAQKGTKTGARPLASGASVLCRLQKGDFKMPCYDVDPDEETEMPYEIGPTLRIGGRVTCRGATLVIDRITEWPGGQVELVLTRWLQEGGRSPFSGD